MSPSQANQLAAFFSPATPLVQAVLISTRLRSDIMPKLETT